MKEIQDKISKLEVVVNSKMIPDSVKAKAKAEIEKLKEELKETKVEEKAEKPKKEKAEKKEPKEKAESKKSEMSLKDCEDLLAKYKAEREARKERAEKREKQGKPAELTPAETAKKAVDRVTDKIEAKAEKGKSVKGDIKAVFNQFKSAVAELKKYKDEIDQDEVRNLIKELESLLTKKMATGGNISGFTNDTIYKKGNISIQRVGGSTMWNVAIDNKPKGRILNAFTQEQAFKKVEKEFESLLTKKMAKGGKMYYYKNAKELSEDDRFELKVLEAISGFNEGQTMNGILEILGYNQYRFGKYASGSELKKVKKALKSLINKGYCEESGLGYEITREGSDYLRTFEYGSY